MNYFCSYPSVKDDNPFLKILFKYLEESEWSQKSIKFRTIHLFKNKKEVSLFWFHWPNSLWRSNNVVKKYFSVFRFVYHVLLASFLGYKLIWSVHNILPHGEKDSKLEFLIRKFIAIKFDLFIGHANNTYKALEDNKIVPKEYILAIHGHYEDEYEERNENITRESLNISNDDVLILIKSGRKNYNSALQFLEVFDSVVTKKIKLLVIGKEVPDNENVIFIPGFVSVEDLSSYMGVSDFIALPYDEITTSGAYFLAITLGKPVIAKSLPFFKEHGGDKSCLLFEDFEDLKSKFLLLEKYKIAFDEGSILDIKNKYSWKKSSKKISEAFNNLLLNS